MSIKPLSRLYLSGDTLIEVLFAVTVFSVVAVSGLSIMNQGTLAAQRSLEISIVRNEIDAQAESLRFLNAAYVANYHDSVTDYDEASPAGQWDRLQQIVNDADVNSFSDSSTCEPRAGSFIIDTRNAKVAEISDVDFIYPPQTFSQLRYNPSNQAELESVDGIWIEAISSPGSGGSGYIDFHIRACWDAVGQLVPASLGTIVRLYEPR
jgi:type II secretory pathway pseudopilin PulG